MATPAMVNGTVILTAIGVQCLYPSVCIMQECLRKSFQGIPSAKAGSKLFPIQMRDLSFMRKRRVILPTPAIWCSLIPTETEKPTGWELSLSCSLNIREQKNTTRAIRITL